MTKEQAIRTTKVVKEFKEEKGKKFKTFQQYAADCIMWDLSDRRGFKQILEQIWDDDKPIYNEIKKTWEYIIAECFKQFEKDLIVEITKES